MLGTLGMTGCEAMSVQDTFFFFQVDVIVNFAFMGIHIFYLI